MVSENVTRAVKRFIGDASIYPCMVLDAIPAYEDGRWFRYGGWGCRLRISYLWAIWGSGAEEELRGRAPAE